MAEWSPIAEPHRVVALDVLRGLAIFGVLVANTLTFAYPMVSSPAALSVWRGTSVADQGVVLLVGLLVEGKFYTLLSFLFGMGLVLLSNRAVAAGQSFTRFYLRRAAWLLVLGVLHGVLLYGADILAFYALVSVAVLPFRNLAASQLVRVAGACAGLGVLVLSLYAWTHPDRPYPRPPDWSRLDQPGGPTPSLIERSAATVLEHVGIPKEEFFGLMADEARVFRDGTWLEMTKSRAITTLLLGLPTKALLLGLIFAAFFLGGMAIMRACLVGGATGSAPAPWLTLVCDSRVLSMYRKSCFAGVPIGLSLVVIASGFQLLMPHRAFTPPIYWAGLFAGLLLQSLGYASGMLLLSMRRPDSPVVQSFAAVGRTALSNYLGQSVVMGLVFYGTGLGLFTRLTALPVVALAIPVFALEVALSRAWLRRYTTGPVEWAWRSLTYGRCLPLRRASAC